MKLCSIKSYTIYYKDYTTTLVVVFVRKFIAYL